MMLYLMLSNNIWFRVLQFCNERPFGYRVFQELGISIVTMIILVFFCFFLKFFGGREINMAS